jgi:hypothetical protein
MAAPANAGETATPRHPPTPGDKDRPRSFPLVLLAHSPPSSPTPTRSLSFSACGCPSASAVVVRRRRGDSHHRSAPTCPESPPGSTPSPAPLLRARGALQRRDRTAPLRLGLRRSPATSAHLLLLNCRRATVRPHCEPLLLPHLSVAPHTRAGSFSPRTRARCRGPRRRRGSGDLLVTGVCPLVSPRRVEHAPSLISPVSASCCCCHSSPELPAAGDVAAFASGHLSLGQQHHEMRDCVSSRTQVKLRDLMHQSENPSWFGVRPPRLARRSQLRRVSGPAPTWHRWVPPLCH